jgi:hypothetical protein
MLGVRIEFMCCADPLACTYEGGGGKSSTSSSTSTQNVDKRQVNDGGSVGVTSDQSTVNVNATQTDQGTVAAALDAFNKAVGFANDNADRTIDLTKSNTAAVGDGIKNVLGFATQALTLTRDNINLQTKSADQIGNAYKTAGDISSGNRAIATTGLVIAGIVAAGFVAVAFKKQKAGGA